MKRHVLCIAFFGFIQFLSGQECGETLQGLVLDYHDKTPLSGASIQIIGFPTIYYTDDKGEFTITKLCVGRYELEISHPDCSTQFLFVEVESKQEERLAITLEHHLEELGEVTVAGKNATPLAKTVNTQSLDKAVIDQYSSGSLGDALKQISGVSSLNTGSTIVKPVVQGLNSSRILIITNNVRLQDQEWGIEHAPNIDLNTADELTVVKGSGALQYGGDAIGGVVLATPKRYAQKDTLYGSTLITGASNGRGGSITSSIDKGFANGVGIRAQGTYKRFGDFQAPNFSLTNTGTEQISATLGAGLNKFKYGLDAYYSFFNTRIGILRAADFGNITDLVRAIESDIPAFTDDFSYLIDFPRQEVTHHLFKTNGFLRISGLGKLSLQYAFQFNDRQEFDNRRGEDDNIPTVDLELVTHNADLVLTVDAVDKTKLSFGLNGFYQENFANPLTGVRRIIPDYDRFGLGVFGGLAYDLSSNWIVDIGGRVDFSQIDARKFYRSSFWELRNYEEDFGDTVTAVIGSQILANPVFNFTNVSATLGVKWIIEDQLELVANYGLASRPPNPSELFSEGLNQSSAAFELGDLRITSENSNKFSFAFSGTDQSGAFNFTVAPYANLISNFIVLEPTGILATTRGSFQVFEYVQNNARLLGVDVDASYQFTNSLGLSTSFAYVNGQDTERNEPIINIPPPNWNNTLSYSYPQFRNLKLALKSEFVFRQSRFPDTNFEAQIIEAGELVPVLVDVSTPPPSYHLLHFNSSIDLLKQKEKLVLGFGVDNILNTEYRQLLNRFRFFADELGRNFNLNLKLIY